MLILVAVTINFALNGGLFNKAKDAARETEKQTILEQIISAMILDNNGNINVPDTYAAVEEMIEAQSMSIEPINPTTVTNDTASVMFNVEGKHGTYTYLITSNNASIVNSNTPVSNAFTVSFNTDGGTPVDSQSVQSGGYATQPATNPTKDGYTFKGWYLSASGDTLFDFNNTEIVADTIIYAQWEEAGPTITGKIYAESYGSSLNFMETDGIYFYGIAPALGNVYTMGTYTFNGTDTITITNPWELNGTISTLGYNSTNDEITLETSTFSNTGSFSYSALQQNDAEFNGLYRREKNGTYEYVLIQYTSTGSAISYTPLNQTFSHNGGNSASEFLTNNSLTYDATNKTIQNGSDPDLYQFVTTIH